LIDASFSGKAPLGKYRRKVTTDWKEKGIPMEIRVTRQTPDKMKPKYTDEATLGFGRMFTDHMFTLTYRKDGGWQDPAIEPYHDFALDPATMGLHYGQLIFEGLKAYRGANGTIYLFRPQENIRRMAGSARRLCKPPVDEALFLKAIETLVLLEQDWIPRGRGTSLYIRPTMIATEKPWGFTPPMPISFILLCVPLVPIIRRDSALPRSMLWRITSGPPRVAWATSRQRGIMRQPPGQRHRHRQGLHPGSLADAVHRRYVEEVGTSNIFFFIGDELITPPLGGTILPGVTRDSVIRLAASWGFRCLNAPGHGGDRLGSREGDPP
jgi:branched-chain amino acid aminotransferase